MECEKPLRQFRIPELVALRRITMNGAAIIMITGQIHIH